MTLQDTIEEKRKSLYTYWDNLQFFKNVNSLGHSLLQQSEVKSFIIKYIRDGMEDDFGKLNNLSRRHAFTTKELYEAFENKSNGQKYSISNFHFHIKSLLEDGYLKEIAKILEGQHYRIYYGRTAITFIPRNDDFLSAQMSQNIFDPMKTLIKEMNPEVEIDYISQLLDENIRLLEDFYYRVFSWLKDKYPELYKSRLDLQAFTSMVGHYSMFHEKLSDNLNRIGSLIDLDQIMNYNRYEIENEESK
ncbi:MAG: hypothetical protein HeimC3_31630 [Candidatus Heimdallarchaeota archaeon LC_3]|nr:MAG: hypothetical protein HeimC3_31630 [Candidatus Heimdallarchaeota archaeon LC_3]